MPTHVVVLAAGEGKRMHSALPKVAHTVAGRSIVEWVLASVSGLEPESIVVVVGHGAEAVRAVLADDVITAIQERQLGTGDAVRVGIDALPGFEPDDTIVVLYGDLPLLTPRLVGGLAPLPEQVSARMVVVELEDPTGYGRVISEDGAVARIVEHRDATEAELEVRDVNAGIYSFRAGDLVDGLVSISNQNAQGEYYLTDVIGILADRGSRIEMVRGIPEEVVGINSQDQLAEARSLHQARINQRLMEAGVWMLDPARTYVDDTVTVEPGARLYPGVHLEGSTTVGAGARVGPDVFAVDATIGAGATVWYSVLREAVVGEECEVGPYASLRAGTVLERRSKVGTFVETKNTVLHEQAKAPHLSYLGDAEVGARSNIGAGSITCNYDGVEKHRTEIGEDVFIGSDTMLVAPLSIGDGATTGAGSVITKDVEAGSLAIERNEQVEVPGYSQRRRRKQAEGNTED